MVFTMTTQLSAEDVLSRAKRFFAERVPHNAAFPEREGPGFLVLRGQGGEEVVIAVFPGEQGTKVRGSSMLFDQQVDRFLSTLPIPVAVS